MILNQIQIKGINIQNEFIEEAQGLAVVSSAWTELVLYNKGVATPGFVYSCIKLRLFCESRISGM